MAANQTIPSLFEELLPGAREVFYKVLAEASPQADQLLTELDHWPHKLNRVSLTRFGELNLYVTTGSGISGEILMALEKTLATSLDLQSCKISLSFEPQALRETNLLCRLLPWAGEAMIRDDFAVFNVLLPELRCSSAESQLTIRIPAGQRKIFTKENVTKLHDFFEERTGLDLQISIQNGHTETYQPAAFLDSREEAFAEMSQEVLSPYAEMDGLPAEFSEPVRVMNEQGEPEVKGIKKNISPKASSKEAKSPKTYRVKQPDSLLWGKMDQRLELTDLKLLDAESGRVSVYGEIAFYEARLVSNNTRSLVKFAIHGLNGAISCVMFLASPEAEEVLHETVKNGVWVRADLDITYDGKFSKDLQGTVRGLCQADPPPGREDLSMEKRVELHLHTNMSAKDGFIRPTELVKLADSFGMPAVAITDHGVVQSFPEACNALDELRKKGSQMKLIYGCEIYLMEDGNAIAYGFGDLPIGDTFVALDLETTGLDSSKDRIIEIGAVRFRKDESGHYFPEERYQTFVNPEIPIPPEVTKLTSITDEMVKGGKETKAALAELHEFMGQDPMVAHNAMFDLGFLRYEAYRVTEYAEPKLKFNPVLIDTLQFARYALPDLKHHRLGDVAKTLNITLQHAHRAIDDAIACGFIFAKLWAAEDFSPLRELNQKAGQHSLAHVKEFRNKPYHAVVLVKDLLGLYNLYRLVSESHIRYFKSKPRIPRSLLTYLRNGLILGSACEAGEVFRSITRVYTEAKGDFEVAKAALSEDKAAQKAARFYDYLEIQPTQNNAFMLEKSDNFVESEEDLRNLNRLVLALGEQTKKPVAATCDAHVLNKEDVLYRQILQVASGFEAQENPTELYFRSTDEMLAEFSWLPPEVARQVVIGTPNQIAAQVSPDLRPFPKGTFPPVIAEAAEEVTRVTWETVRSKYEKDGQIPENIRLRVEKELRSIIDNGFGIMYYISHKLVKKTNDDGYIVGSRGSVGSSVVAFFCGISEVNPLPPHYVCPSCHETEFVAEGQYGSGFDLPVKSCPVCGTEYIRDGQDIPFETFLGFNGDKQPDIDLNFSGEYQSTAHQTIEIMFGSEHTYRAGTITGFAEKNAAGLVLKYMEETGLFLTKAEISRLAQGLNGVKRSTGQHPGGIVVIPKDREIYDFTPIQYPADKETAVMNTTHFDFNSMHDTILKLDILGHDDPTMLKVMSDYTGVKIEEIPIPDQKVMDLFTSTAPLGLKPGSTPADCGTLGLPEMGTRMARDMIKETKPTKFFDLVQLMGLSHGTDVWNGNAQDLIRSGTATINDVIGCRDGIMTNLINWGLPPKSAFDIMEKVRKGKGLTAEQEALMLENQVPEWYIESCKKIKYMFPKAHAAAYVISSLRVAWFKVYKPAAYYAAYFSVRADEFDYVLMCQPLAKISAYREDLNRRFHELTDREVKIYYIIELVEEMYLRGLTFAPISIETAGASRFDVLSDTCIMPALNTVPSISAAMAQGIVEARKDGPFKSHEDLQRRSGLGASAVKSLVDAGILGDIPETAQLSLFDMM